MAKTILQKKYDDLLDRQLKLHKEISDLRIKIEKMQTTLKNKGNCDGLCGICILFNEGCLIWTTLKGKSRG